MPFLHGFPDALCFFGEVFVSLFGEFLFLFWGEGFWFLGFGWLGWWGGAVEGVGECVDESLSPFV